MAGDQNRFQTAMMHGDRFSQQGQWDEAMRAYRFALAEFPNNEAAILGFGKAGLASGQVELAYRAFQQALRINPTNLKVLDHFGDVQERMGQLDAAAETYLRIGNVHFTRDELDSAIDAWTRATKLSSGHAEAHRKIADALAQQNNIRLAAREYLRVAAIYQRRNEPDRVMECIEAASNLVPDDPGVTAALEAVQQGSAIQPQKIADTPPEPEIDPDFDDPGDDFDDTKEEDIGDWWEPPIEPQPTESGGLIDSARQKAMSELANIIFEDSDSPGAMLIIQGLDQQSREEYPEAINNYEKAINMGSKQSALYFNLGLLYKDQDQIQPAIEMLQTAAQDNKYQVSALYALGTVYQRADDLEQAVRHYVETLQVIDLQTVSGQQSYELAAKYENLTTSFAQQLGAAKANQFVTTLDEFFSKPDWERSVYEARQRMNKVSEEDNVMSLVEFLEAPETEIVVTTLAVTTEYINNSMLMTASEECLRAIQKAPGFLLLHARLAEILLKQNYTDQAITKYLYIAHVYLMRGQPDQVANIYQKILKLAPMDVTVRSSLIDLYMGQKNILPALEQYLTLADSYYQLAQVDRALEKYNEALRLTTDVDGDADTQKWQVEALTRMADIYNQRFDWPNATSAYEELLKVNPGDNRTLRQLIDLYFKQGKHNEARRYLDQLLGIYQRQNPRKALELLQELSSYYPDDMALRQRLAVAFAQNNMNREAIAQYDALGEMQLEHGLRDQAIQTIQAIINLKPDDVEGYQRLLEQINGGAL